MNGEIFAVWLVTYVLGVFLTIALNNFAWDLDIAETVFWPIVFIKWLILNLLKVVFTGWKL